MRLGELEGRVVVGVDELEGRVGRIEFVIIAAVVFAGLSLAVASSWQDDVFLMSEPEVEWIGQIWTSQMETWETGFQECEPSVDGISIICESIKTTEPVHRIREYEIGLRSDGVVVWRAMPKEE